MTLENAYHYQTMRRAIEFIDAATDPLTLEDVANAVGLSPAHFQRTFSAWVGVSPKRYQQYLTLAHAKGLLRDKFTTLDTALSVGLSGTSRLHDLFIRWEGMSPGEFARHGDGTNISYGWFNSPFGEMLVMGTDRGICGMAFSSETGRKLAMQDMAGRWPYATFTEEPAKLQSWVNAFVTQTGETRLHMIGTTLQLKVWEALLNIPSGHVTTYSEIAACVENPKAVRAVGSAVGRNPVSWIIPCHRALRKSGALGGYHWGLPVKRAMLAYEGARADATNP